MNTLLQNKFDLLWILAKYWKQNIAVFINGTDMMCSHIGQNDVELRFCRLYQLSSL